MATPLRHSICVIKFRKFTSNFFILFCFYFFLSCHFSFHVKKKFWYPTFEYKFCGQFFSPPLPPPPDETKNSREVGRGGEGRRELSIHVNSLLNFPPPLKKKVKIQNINIVKTAKNFIFFFLHFISFSLYFSTIFLSR